jgi:hypothetical protein
MPHVPLLLFPFALYNIFAFAIFENAERGFREASMFSIPMVSGASFTLTVSDTLVIVALVGLGFEVVKAARVGVGSVTDHVFATGLLIVFLLEFLLVGRAATGTFLVLTVIALVDLVCGFAVSIRTAQRDISLA